MSPRAPEAHAPPRLLAARLEVATVTPGVDRPGPRIPVMLCASQRRSRPCRLPPAIARAPSRLALLDRSLVGIASPAAARALRRFGIGATIRECEQRLCNHQSNSAHDQRQPPTCNRIAKIAGNSARPDRFIAHIETITLITQPRPMPATGQALGAVASGIVDQFAAQQPKREFAAAHQPRVKHPGKRRV